MYNCVEKKPHSSSGTVLNLCKWAGSRLVSAITDLALQNEGREHLCVQHWIPTQSVPPSTFRKPRFHLIFLASHRCEPCFLQMEGKFSAVTGSGRWQRPCVAGGLSEPHLRRTRELSWAGMGLGMWGQRMKLKDTVGRGYLKTQQTVTVYSAMTTWRLKGQGYKREFWIGWSIILSLGLDYSHVCACGWACVCVCVGVFANWLVISRDLSVSAFPKLGL